MMGSDMDWARKRFSAFLRKVASQGPSFGIYVRGDNKTHEATREVLNNIASRIEEHSIDPFRELTICPNCQHYINAYEDPCKKKEQS
jgi:hypothetical protein